MGNRKKFSLQERTWRELGWGNQQITVFLIPHPRLLPSSLFTNQQQSPQALFKHTHNSEEPATSTKPEISKQSYGAKSSWLPTGQSSSTIIKRYLVGCLEKQRREIMLCLVPQVRFPSTCLLVLRKHRDNAKDKKEADNWVLCFCQKAFIPWGKAF